MKNIIITALLVSNVFTAAILYCFTSGTVARGEGDYLSAMTDDVKPVQLSRR